MIFIRGLLIEAERICQHNRRVCHKLVWLKSNNSFVNALYQACSWEGDYCHCQWKWHLETVRVPVQSAWATLLLDMLQIFLQGLLLSAWNFQLIIEVLSKIFSNKLPMIQAFPDHPPYFIMYLELPSMKNNPLSEQLIGSLLHDQHCRSNFEVLFRTVELSGSPIDDNDASFKFAISSLLASRTMMISRK